MKKWTDEIINRWKSLLTHRKNMWSEGSTSRIEFAFSTSIYEYHMWKKVRFHVVSTKNIEAEEIKQKEIGWENSKEKNPLPKS